MNGVVVVKPPLLRGHRRERRLRTATVEMPERQQKLDCQRQKR
jgi:hypothetical protein